MVSTKHAFPTKPLPFRDESYPIAFLVNGNIASITKNNGIGIGTIAVVAHGASLIVHRSLYNAVIVSILFSIVAESQFSLFFTPTNR